MATKQAVKTFDTSDEFEEFRFADHDYGLILGGVYHIIEHEQWAYSPDGIGCYWYDSEEALREDAGL